jgi:U3 small nucleolar RNA-associated protein 14
MFYEQLKRHRLNKIKSKAYRRIRKKQKQRLQQSQSEGIVDEDDDEEEQKEKDEKEALKRVQERMDLRHKNTNRWSKMALKYGRSDTSLR